MNLFRSNGLERMLQPVELSGRSFGADGGSPLLILHGLFASSRNWVSLAQRFAAHHRVFALDLRNHGSSPHAWEMDYDHMVADVCAFLDAEGVEKAAVLGHSMGGKAAMWLALNVPHRVSKLVVADIAPVAYPHSFVGVVRALKGLPLATIKNRKEADAWLETHILDSRLRQFLLQNLVYREQRYQWRLNLDALEHGVENIVGFPETLTGARFAGDALFVVGERSEYIDASGVKRIESLFPDARLETIKDAGHWLHVERPEAFTETVLDFLT